ncbi:DNA alkylation repair protein [Shewanella kaireitica]|uniref:DNA alkylation repair protein n=1 Tax=Shewanella kaireitica TaxID=212021 RepID=UPI00200E3C5F|nr:DNA alkylation repair protein [Shewanella kaireitica]
MTNYNQYHAYHCDLLVRLNAVSSAENTTAMTRFFNHEVNFIGVKAPMIKQVVREFQVEQAQLDANGYLALTEHILEHAKYTEEVLLAFGLINKFVKRHYDEKLLLRFQYWLEHYVSNWSHVDDLCIKTVYQFMLSRPHLIETTQSWTRSASPWCRRAANVVWVKFIKRKIGKNTFMLSKALIFENCDRLLKDEDPFVQKSVGWLLKVAAVEHEEDVIRYLKTNINSMQRATLRYAIEKLDPCTRKQLLSNTSKGKG